MSENLTAVGLQSYHENLSRAERGRLKNYIAMKLDISYFSVDGKFVGRQKWKPAELAMVQPIIESEEWRQ